MRCHAWLSYMAHLLTTTPPHHPTDTFHKPGFKTHCKILHLLCDVVQGPVLQGPLWDVAAKGPAAYPNNLAYVSEFVTTLLATSFPNLRPQQVQVGAMMAWDGVLQTSCWWCRGGGLLHGCVGFSSVERTWVPTAVTHTQCVSHHAPHHASLV